MICKYFESYIKNVFLYIYIFYYSYIFHFFYLFLIESALISKILHICIITHTAVWKYEYIAKIIINIASLCSLTNVYPKKWP